MDHVIVTTHRLGRVLEATLPSLGHVNQYVLLLLSHP